MTPLAEARDSNGVEGRPLSVGWRHAAEGQQVRVLPEGKAIVSCPAPFGVGGLGRHLSEIVAAFDRRDQSVTCICEPAPRWSVPTGDTVLPAVARRRDLRGQALSMTLAPLTRLSPSWRMWTVSVRFDACAARTLKPADHLIAFNGTAAAQFRAGKRQSFESLSLVAANSHFRHVVACHARAYSQYPIERPWATRLLKRNLAEYDRADRIYVATDYIHESFVTAGFDSELLSRFPLTPDERFAPTESVSASSTFNIVYVGSLTVHKGVPLLIDAIRRLPFDDLRLILVGGWGTRGMRRFVERACAADTRISVRPGDPLAHLLGGHLCVHAAYEDGFGYAPAEALACGVPVLVSEDTGMKELVEHGRNGLILPTGDLEAWSEAIEAVYRGQATDG